MVFFRNPDRFHLDSLCCALPLQKMTMLSSKNPHIAVVIPARNEEELLGRTIDAIEAQGYLPLSLIVADSASTDKTAFVARQRNAKVVELAIKGVARARNEGARLALRLDPDILVFIDADSLMGPGLLNRVAEQVKYGNKLAGTCRIVLDKQHWRARLTSSVLNFLQRFHRAPHSFMFAVPDVFDIVSFDEKMVMAEDEKWAYSVMKKFGWKKYVLITNAYVKTSARRFEKYGYWNILYKWWTNLPFSLSDKEKEDTYFD